MKNHPPVLKNIVLVGAGHAHIGVLRAFGLNPLCGVRVTLITRQVQTPYSGMLPGLIAGHYSFADAHIDVRPLCQFARAELHHSAVIGLDLLGKRVFCDNRPPVPYDLLSINIGATPNTHDVKGAAGDVIPVKPIDGFLEHFDKARERIAEKGAKASIAVIGAGAGGTELMLSLEHCFRRDASRSGHDPAGLSFAIVASGPKILPSFPAAVRRRFMNVMRKRGIELLLNKRVTSVECRKVHFADGTERQFDEIFWTTAAAPAPWLAGTGLELDGRGFIAVNQTLQSISHPYVFAAGDIAAMEDKNLPKAGVYAVRQGPVLAENLRRAAANSPLKAYRSQRSALYLISTGEAYAIGTRNGLTFEGAWVWRLKDWIDRRFMAKFKTLPNRSPDFQDVPPVPAPESRSVATPRRLD